MVTQKYRDLIEHFPLVPIKSEKKHHALQIVEMLPHKLLQSFMK